MAPPSQSRQSYEYLDALLTAIPNESIPPEIASPSQGAHRPYPKFIDTALRLASGGPAHPDDEPHIRDAWPEIQASVQRALHALHPSTASTGPSSQKRKHSPSTPGTNSKKTKFEDGGDNSGDDGDDGEDVPQLTLHALSATAPVRHKIDITAHARTLRLAHSTTGAQVARCARTALTRVFLLPTRARSSGALQWTALLLAGDKPTPPSPRGAGGKAAAAVRFELACSVPDSSKPAAVPRMTLHASTSAASQVTSTRDALLALLSSTISNILVPLTTVERGAQLAGITAFRGVRETSLWFFDRAGILADGRPAEFWSVADLARGEAGVRVRTATGRTCSVVLMRRGERDGDGDGGEDEEEEEDGEETEFQMIDGKERERILDWVRRNRGAFGVTGIQKDGAQVPSQGAAGKGKENGKSKGAGAGQEGAEGTDARGGEGEEGDSDSDSDFEEESGESDDGSPSSGSSSGSGPGPGSDAGSEAGSSEHEDEARSGGGSGSEGGGGGREDDDDDDAMELEPEYHPLLRAGGLPKMSRAAMDAAVELVVGDLVGEARQDDPPGSGSGSGLGRPVEVEGDDDEEDDELED